MADGVSAITSPPNFEPDRLEAFSASLSGKAKPDDTGGKHGRPFGEGLPGVAADRLPTGLVPRSTVMALASDLEVGTATVCAAAMAWGGMRMHHRNMAFCSPHAGEWLAVADRLRTGRLARAEGYEAFRALRTASKLKGMGPAYFTKLIYFLMPRDGSPHLPGFIMDQWAGCSVNVLMGREIVLMDSTGTWKRKRKELKKTYSFRVSDINTGEDYEAFCATVDRLASYFGKSGDEIDRALLSDGGRAPAEWRRYVMEYRRA